MSLNIIALSLFQSGNNCGNKLATSGNKNVASNPQMFQSTGNIFKACIPCNYRLCGGLLPMLPLLPVKKGHPRKVSERGAI